jgi:hypothetical protein
MLRFLIFAAAAWLALLSAPAAAQQSLPTDRHAPLYLLKYWRSHGPGSTLGTSTSETAPGIYPAAPAMFVHGVYGGKLPAPQADLLRRRLDVVFKALMSQPSLADIHGASLDVAINISRAQTEEEGVLPVTANLTFRAKRILKDDAKTIEKNGRFATPWLEGSVLEVSLNPYDFIAHRNVVVAGPPQGRLQALNAGTTMALLVSDTPAPAEFDRQALARELAHDSSWLGGAGKRPILMRVSGARHENLDVWRERTAPTDPLARLIAAAYMTDWDAVQRQVAAVR